MTNTNFGNTIFEFFESITDGLQLSCQLWLIKSLGFTTDRQDGFVGISSCIVFPLANRKFNARYGLPGLRKKLSLFMYYVLRYAPMWILIGLIIFGCALGLQFLWYSCLISELLSISIWSMPKAIWNFSKLFTVHLVSDFWGFTNAGPAPEMDLETAIQNSMAFMISFIMVLLMVIGVLTVLQNVRPA